MTRLQTDLSKRDAGWDYIELTLPDTQIARCYVSRVSKNRIELIWKAPKELGIRNVTHEVRDDK